MVSETSEEGGGQGGAIIGREGGKSGGGKRLEINNETSKGCHSDLLQSVARRLSHQHKGEILLIGV